MRQIVYTILIVLFVVVSTKGIAIADEFPTKPVKFVVYTNPGGLIDISARKFAQVLEKEKLGKPIVVENKKGAGGLVAIQHVLRSPADGHTILALTSSVISKAVEANQESKVQQLEMLVRLVDDYECLIVKEDGKYQTLEALTQALSSGKTKTIWAGPAVGGTDHLFALKYWNAVGGRGTWTPKQKTD